MKTKKRPSTIDRRSTNAEAVARLNRRRRRRVLKTVTGAVIGGIVAGPVGVAAGALAGASVRRGPVRTNAKAGVKMNSNTKTKTRKANLTARRCFTSFYPNIP